MAAPQVLVAGAGVVGLSTAYYLSGRGFSVQILDPGPFPSPTTCASLGVLTHFNGGDDPYSQLYRQGHALHAELAARLRDQTGIDVGWRPLGGVDLACSETEIAEARQLLAFNLERGCPAEWVEGEDLRQLERSLSARVLAGVYFPTDQRVDPELLSRALLQAAQEQGARLSLGEGVEEFAQQGQGVRVRTRAGEHRADFLVLAIGAWTGELAQHQGLSLPVRPVRGQHCRFTGGTELRHVLRHQGIHLVPAGEEILAGATVEETGFDTQTTPQAAEHFIHLFSQVLDLPARLLGQRAGLRPKPKGGRPHLGPLQAQPRVFVAAGHYKNGVLLGPLTGQLLADWIATGRPPFDLQRFAPER
ncbi:MAG: FAD-binding oxidoreductase [Candidatus Latescibacteria bacterium]|nr:FAD-binding oxidoreductase [Candidatus Latescibacterota bacterium]